MNIITRILAEQMVELYQGVLKIMDAHEAIEKSGGSVIIETSPKARDIEVYSYPDKLDNEATLKRLIDYVMDNDGNVYCTTMEGGKELHVHFLSAIDWAVGVHFVFN